MVPAVRVAFVFHLVFLHTECAEDAPPHACHDSTCDAVNGHALLQFQRDSPVKVEPRLMQASAIRHHREHDEHPYPEKSAPLPVDFQHQLLETSAVGKEQSTSARNLLPSEIFELGIQLLGSESLLDDLVAKSRVQTVSYAGVPVLLRMLDGDLSNGTMISEGGESVYGLEGLDGIVPSPQQRINMIDLGGNYGVVSIAAFKKFPMRLRAVAIEPVPSTYFFLRWNMFLNGVPALEPHDFPVGTRTGVIALNKGIAKDDSSGMGICYWPPYTMNAQICDCQHKETWPTYFPRHITPQCTQIGSVSTRSLVDMFGSEPIAHLKMDCEGCEFVSLPQVMQLLQGDPSRIRRLSGELHWPTREIEDMACQFDSGKYLVRICAGGGIPLTCGESATPCASPPEATTLMSRITRLAGGSLASLKMATHQRTVKT